MNNTEEEENHTWELSKENIQPIRKGREIKKLSSVLNELSSTEEEKKKRQSQRDKFELNIQQQSDIHDDPIVLWIEYINWMRVEFPSNDPCLIPVLERATRALMKDKKYAADQRYLNLWCAYGDMLDDASDVFAFLSNKGFFTDMSIFHIARAYIYENKCNYTAADKCYVDGKDKGAKPAQKLADQHNYFKKRMLDKIVEYNKNIVDEEPPIDGGFSRKALETLTSKNMVTMNEEIRGAVRRNNSRGNSDSDGSVVGLTRGAASTQITRSNHSIKPRMTSNTSSFTVFVDENEPIPSSTTAGSWNDFGTAKIRNKENEREAEKWSGVTMGDVAVSAKETDSTFAIFTDATVNEIVSKPKHDASKSLKSSHQLNDAEQIMKNPLKNFAEKKRVLTERKETLNPPLESSSCSLSFEELKAAKYLQRKRERLAEEEKEKERMKLENAKRDAELAREKLKYEKEKKEKEDKIIMDKYNEALAIDKAKTLKLEEDTPLITRKITFTSPFYTPSVQILPSLNAQRKREKEARELENAKMKINEVDDSDGSIDNKVEFESNNNNKDLSEQQEAEKNRIYAESESESEINLSNLEKEDLTINTALALKDLSAMFGYEEEFTLANEIKGNKERKRSLDSNFGDVSCIQNETMTTPFPANMSAIKHVTTPFSFSKSHQDTPFIVKKDEVEVRGKGLKVKENKMVLKTHIEEESVEQVSTNEESFQVFVEKENKDTSGDNFTVCNENKKKGESKLNDEYDFPIFQDKKKEDTSHFAFPNFQDAKENKVDVKEKKRNPLSVKEEENTFAVYLNDKSVNNQFCQNKKDEESCFSVFEDNIDEESENINPESGVFRKVSPTRAIINPLKEMPLEKYCHGEGMLSVHDVHDLAHNLANPEYVPDYDDDKYGFDVYEENSKAPSVIQATVKISSSSLSANQIENFMNNGIDMLSCIYESTEESENTNTAETSYVSSKRDSTSSTNSELQENLCIECFDCLCPITELNMEVVQKGIYVPMGELTYGLDAIIGRSSSSICYRTIERKCVKVSSIAEAHEYKIQKKVFSLLEKSNCERFVVQPLNLILFKDKAVLFMNGGTHGTLRDLIHINSKSGVNMSPILVTYYSIELLKCLQSIHGVGIIHGSIKPSHLLVRDGPSTTNNGDKWMDWKNNEEGGWKSRGLSLIGWREGKDITSNIDVEVDVQGCLKTILYLLTGLEDEKEARKQAKTLFTYGLIWDKVINGLDSMEPLFKIREILENYMKSSASRVKPLLCRQQLAFFKEFKV